MTKRKVILYGGTFDPCHKGHVELPYYVADLLGMDEVWFLPAGNPPHKNRKITPAVHRIAMLEASLKFRSRTSICYFDAYREGPCYTVDTLQTLCTAHPEIDWHFLMGTDQALSFETWDKYRLIPSLAQIIIMIRPPDTKQDVRQRLPLILQENATIILPPSIAVSSTMLRELLQKGDYDNEIVKENLYPSVRKYIREHDLYVL